MKHLLEVVWAIYASRTDRPKLRPAEMAQALEDQFAERGLVLLSYDELVAAVHRAWRMPDAVHDDGRCMARIIWKELGK